MRDWSGVTLTRVGVEEVPLEDPFVLPPLPLPGLTFARALAVARPADTEMTAVPLSTAATRPFASTVAMLVFELCHTRPYSDSMERPRTVPFVPRTVVSRRNVSPAASWSSSALRMSSEAFAIACFSSSEMRFGCSVPFSHAVAREMNTAGIRGRYHRQPPEPRNGTKFPFVRGRKGISILH